MGQDSSSSGCCAEGDTRSLCSSFIGAMLKKENGLHSQNKCVLRLLQGCSFFFLCFVFFTEERMERQKAGKTVIILDIQAYLMRRQRCGKQKKAPIRCHSNPAERTASEESLNDTPTKSPCSTLCDHIIWFSSALSVLCVRSKPKRIRASFSIPI